MSYKEDYLEKVDKFSGFFYEIAGLVAIGILGYQGYMWLKHGEWLPLPFYWLFAYNGIDLSSVASLEWGGVKKVLVWILELPLSLMMFLLICLCGLLFQYIFSGGIFKLFKD